MESIKLIMRAVAGLCLVAVICPAVAQSSYKINPGDLLRIDVWNEESLTREVIVQPDG